MPAHPLDDAYARWSRAWSQLEELDKEARVWVLANRYRFPLEYDRQLKKRVIVARSPDPQHPIGRVPLEIGVIAGDAVNNLRSALNYVVWRLALARGETHDRLQFPVVHDFGTKKYDVPARDRFAEVAQRYRLDLIGEENLAFIERMQPYQGPRWAPLAFLADLNDLDKHRVLATHQHVAVPELPKFYGLGTGTKIRMQPAPTLREGAHMVVFDRYIPHPDPDVKMHFDPPATILFGPAGGRMGNPDALRSVAMLVHRILWVFHERAYPRVGHGR